MAGRRARAAFTLIEVLVASSILAIGVVGLAHALVTSEMLNYEGLHNARALALADALLEEVMALPYDDPDGGGGPGPESGEDARANFDNMDDYHGFMESAGNVTDVAGNGYPAAFAQFSRGVSAAYGSVSVSAFSAAVNGLTVTVTVTDSKTKTWTLTRFIAEP